jgi:hypothetical protein
MRSSLVGVQPVLHFGPEFLTLLVNALIDLAAIIPIGYDRIDRPEHDKNRDKKRKGSHGVRSLLPLRQRNNRVTRFRVPYDGLTTQLEPGISRRSYVVARIRYGFAMRKLWRAIVNFFVEALADDTAVAARRNREANLRRERWLRYLS